MKKKLTYLFLLALGIGQWLVAQSPHFNTYEIEALYPNGQVNLIYEDPHAILWLGTSAGLFLFDGQQYNPFLRADTLSNEVTAIFQDQEGVLWVGYADGAIAHLLNQELITWEPIRDSIQEPIKGMIQDDRGRIWMATYGQGMLVWDQQKLQMITDRGELLSNNIYDLVKDRYNNIWVATDEGITICGFSNGTLSFKNMTREQGLPDEIVKDLLVDASGNIWIGTFDKGICYFDLESRIFKYPLEKEGIGEVTCMEIFDDKELWVGTNGNELWRYDFLTQTFSQVVDQKDFLGTKIYDLCKDVEGNLWVVSDENGIRQANRQFEYLPTDFQNIQSVLSDEDNGLWIGTQNGLFKYKPKQEPSFELVLPNTALNILSLYKDKYGVLWIGTFGDGVLCFDPDTKEKRWLTEQDGLSNNSVISIDGQNGHIWLATLGGVTEFEIAQNIFDIQRPQFHSFDQESGLGTNYTYKIYIDSQEKVWFASDGKGVSVLENGHFTNYTHAMGWDDRDSLVEIPLKAVYSITEDAQGHIWLSTAEQGIFEFDGEYFQQLTVKEGIRDLEITSLIRDKKGNILIVHPTGIDILDPLTHHLIYYGEEVGIENIAPNLNAVTTDQYDDIWIAGQKELIRYSPLNEDLEIHPRTLINKVSIFLEPVDFVHTNLFTHQQNNLVFDYMGVWYTFPETVKYRYILEGYDHDWISSADTRATYSNLPPGEYAFKVMSTENDFFSHEPIAAYEFEILSPIWMRTWFILLMGIIVLGLFRWYQLSRDARLQKVNLLEKERAESQLEAIKAQINPHFLFNSFNTLVAIIEDDQELAVEYVENLSDFYRSILQYRDKEIIPIKEELEIVEKYGFLLKKRFGDNFNMNIQVNGEPIYVAPFTLQVLIENAIKHNVISAKKPLHITITVEEGEFVVVKNNLQKKKEKPKSTAFGLESIAQRYQLMVNKSIEVLETGSEFIVKIPVIK